MVHCSTLLPIEGFELRVAYVPPTGAVAEGKDANAAALPGMKPLLQEMARIVRATDLDFTSIMEQAVKNLSGGIDSNGMVDALNAIRVARGEPPLVSAEASTAEAIDAAVLSARREWSQGEEQRLADRMRQAIEADRAGRVAVRGEDFSETAGDPPPPRGTVKRRQA